MVDSTITAAFAGEHGGEAPLTWGQYGMWMAIQRNPRSQFSIVRVVTVPSAAPGTVAAAAEAIGSLVSRHEALRTVVRVHDGSPRQHLIRSGSLPIRLIETQADELDATVERERAAGTNATFDREAELPLRAGLIVCDGVVRRILLVFDHLAVDGAGASIAAEDLQVLLEGGVLPPPGLQPGDLAQKEQDAKRSITDGAVRYWTEQLRRLPPRMFSQVGPPDEPRTQVAVMASPALVTAGNMLAARHKTTLSITLLAATAALVGVWTGHPMVALNIVVGNRFRPELARIVSNVQKLGLFVLDVAESSTLDQLIPQAHRSALRTYRYAYYDQAAMDRATAEVAAERGTDINPFACYNDFSPLSGEAPSVDPGEVNPRAMLPATTMTWPSDPSQVRCHFCLRVWGADHASHRVSLSANTDYLRREDIEWFLLSLERYVVNSLFEDLHFRELRKRIAESWQPTASAASDPPPVR